MGSSSRLAPRETRADATGNEGRLRRVIGATCDRCETGLRRAGASANSVAVSASVGLVRRGVDSLGGEPGGEAATTGATTSAVTGVSILGAVTSVSIVGAASGGAVGLTSVESWAGSTLPPIAGAGVASVGGGAGRLSPAGGCVPGASVTGSSPGAGAGGAAAVADSAASTGAGAGSGSGFATAVATGGAVGGADSRIGSRDSGST